MAAAAAMVAIQIAGTMMSVFQGANQRSIMEAGRAVEHDQLLTNLQMLNAQSAQESLAEMKQLRENIGSQIAIQAARGTASGAGIAASLQARSKGKFGEDEQSRRLNLLAKQSALKAADSMSGFNTLAGETKLGQAVSEKIFNTIGTKSTTDYFFGGAKKESK